MHGRRDNTTILTDFFFLSYPEHLRNIELSNLAHKEMNSEIESKDLETFIAIWPSDLYLLI